MRPLFICQIWGTTDFTFASELGMLQWMIERQFAYDKNRVIFPLSPHNLMTIHLDSGKVTNTPIVYPVTPKKKTFFTTALTTSQDVSTVWPHQSQRIVHNDDYSPDTHRYVTINKLGDYAVAKEIVFALSVTQSLSDDPTNPRWLITGIRDDLPGVGFRYICKSAANKKDIETSLIMKGSIVHISYDTSSQTKKEHKIYVSGCLPCNDPNETTDIVGRTALQKLFGFMSEINHPKRLQ